MGSGVRVGLGRVVEGFRFVFGVVGLSRVVRAFRVVFMSLIVKKKFENCVFLGFVFVEFVGFFVFFREGVDLFFFGEGGLCKEGLGR